eukprot:Filipodium_phascolosomae@DN2038_c0_g1_i1.p1
MRTFVAFALFILSFSSLITGQSQKKSRATADDSDAPPVEIADPVWGCPVGYSYESSGKNCVKTYEVEPTKHCEDGAELVDDQNCFKRLQIQPINECIPGFDLVKGMCVKVENSELQMSCPGNSELNEITHMCERKSDANPTLVCPSGRLMGNVCIEETSVPSEAICPPGYQKAANSCTLWSDEVVEGTTKCRRGAAYDRSSGKCLTTIPAKMSCPDGFLRAGLHLCKKSLTKTAPSILECPDATILEGNSCFSEDFFPPEMVCPSGSITAGNNCVQQKVTLTSSSCPSEYVFSKPKDSCERTLEKDPQIFCLEGSYDETRKLCIIKNSITPTFTCGANEEYSSDKECIMTNTQAPMMEL